MLSLIPRLDLESYEFLIGVLLKSLKGLVNNDWEILKVFSGQRPTIDAKYL